MKNLTPAVQRSSIRTNGNDLVIVANIIGTGTGQLSAAREAGAAGNQFLFDNRRDERMWNTTIRGTDPYFHWHFDF